MKNRLISTNPKIHKNVQFHLFFALPLLLLHLPWLRLDPWNTWCLLGPSIMYINYRPKKHHAQGYPNLPFLLQISYYYYLPGTDTVRGVPTILCFFQKNFIVQFIHWSGEMAIISAFSSWCHFELSCCYSLSPLLQFHFKAVTNSLTQEILLVNFPFLLALSRCISCNPHSLTALFTGNSPIEFPVSSLAVHHIG